MFTMKVLTMRRSGTVRAVLLAAFLLIVSATVSLSQCQQGCNDFTITYTDRTN